MAIDQVQNSAESSKPHLVHDYPNVFHTYFGSKMGVS